MSKIRQDAWSEEDDLLLAETVLRHVREGSTQLHAFEEVGDKLERTSAAVGFRWNAIVRKKYEQALKIAKKQRKERQRALARSQQQQPKPTAKPVQPIQQVQTPQMHDDETYHPEEFFKTPYTYDNNTAASTSAATPAAHTPASYVQQQAAEAPPVSEVSNTHAASPVSYSNRQPQPSNRDGVTLDEVIDFLTGLKRNGMASGKLVQENMELRLQMNELMQQNKVMKEQLAVLEKEHQTVQEDYQALIQIMDRARKMVLFQDEETNPNVSFRMDKNGNLEKLAK
ncbi:RsfA family transcriptional regulator [Fictibacillus sp. b24]|uniref:RsfA family transcriptional regulator n=1 Tax=Fictibacillus sp. b24 TaxID=3055863 RepID=UPI0025A132F3|nr:RsfA family transcriptional regulator [Fictibacillus sp. b24]MDM5315754.1 RsfA family transcriptional regulator [Fictibacillus sp. b24]